MCVCVLYVIACVFWQDTVVALQALAKYASLVYGEGVDLTVDALGSDLDHTFTINNHNSLLLQQRPITLPNSVGFTIRGTGCALVQVRALSQCVCRLYAENY